jgi:hypothetical protein
MVDPRATSASALHVHGGHEVGAEVVLEVGHGRRPVREEQRLAGARVPNVLEGVEVPERMSQRSDQPTSGVLKSTRGRYKRSAPRERLNTVQSSAKIF